jgi:hypothetical protein
LSDISKNAESPIKAAEIGSVSSDGSSSQTSETASPTPASGQEASEAFKQLKEYCDAHKLKNAIDLDNQFPIFTLEIRNGRAFRSIYVTEETAPSVLRYPIHEITFLGDYSAVCSYKHGWIEAAVRSHGTATARNYVARRSIFGVTGLKSDGSSEIEIANSNGLAVRLTEKRGILTALDYPAPIYMRIEGIGITEHDKAVALLEDLSNSLFMQIDFRFDAALALGRDRGFPRRSSRTQRKLDEDDQITFPSFSYEKSPSSLYWYGRSAASMPLLQFLAFYQCIEFFFPQYSRQSTIAKIKNVLKDPAFDGAKDSCVNTILNATMEGRRGVLLDERKQLGATFKNCIDSTALADFLNESEDRKLYYSGDYKKISDRKISLTDESLVVEQTAERIYDIRCKVVHTKNLDGGDGDEMILPFSKEADLLMSDVELLKFLARKVLIASSVPLKI